MDGDKPIGTPSIGVAISSPALPRGRLLRLAWLPIPILLLAMAALWVADVRTAYESPHLLIALDFLTRTLACLLIVYLAGRSFLARGESWLLLLGCGVMTWGATGFVATSTLAVKDANLGVTISNLGIWVAALCHLMGAISSLRLHRTIRPAGPWLGIGYLLALGIVGLITILTLADRLPVFFVEGQGGMPVRHIVLGTALAMFAMTAVLLWDRNRVSPSPFAYWYALALLLIAAGVLGMMLQSSRNSLLNWTCRTTQYLGGIYMFIAAVAAARQTGTWKISLSEMEEAWVRNELLPAFRKRHWLGFVLRYSSAVVAVAVAFGLRQAITERVGPGMPPYLMFATTGIIVMLFAGFGPGVLCILLTDLVVAHWILAPVDQLAVALPVDRLGLMIYTGVSLFFCTIVELYRRNRVKAAAYDREVALRGSQEALRKSEDRYHSLFTSMTEGFAVHEIITDASGKPIDYRFLDINPAFERLTGHKRQNVIGRTVKEVMPGTDEHWIQTYGRWL